MPSAISRNIKHRRSRKGTGVNRPQPITPIMIATAVATGSVLVLTFDQPVSLSGTPGFTVNVAGAKAISATQGAPNVVAITFDHAIAAATSVGVGFRDPAIRNASGGFVTGNSAVVT